MIHEMGTATLSPMSSGSYTKTVKSYCFDYTELAYILISQLIHEYVLRRKLGILSCKHLPHNLDALTTRRQLCLQLVCDPEQLWVSELPLAHHPPFPLRLRFICISMAFPLQRLVFPVKSLVPFPLYDPH